MRLEGTDIQHQVSAGLILQHACPTKHVERRGDSLAWRRRHLTDFLLGEIGRDFHQMTGPMAYLSRQADQHFDKSISGVKVLIGTLTSRLVVSSTARLLICAYASFSARPKTSTSTETKCGLLVKSPMITSNGTPIASVSSSATARSGRTSSVALSSPMTSPLFRTS